jgi:hypothetical protein
MTKTLTVKTRGIVPTGSRLERSLLELHEAVASQYESFFKTGCVLERIRVDREFADAGYDSFNQYMNEAEPCGIKANMASKTIRSKNIRPELPTSYKFNGTNRTIDWSEWTVRPLTKLETKRGRKTVAGRVVKAIVAGEKFTANLVKREVDHYTGADTERTKKKADKIKDTETAGDILVRIEFEAEQWLQSLESVSSEFWEDADRQDSGCAKRAADSLGRLSSFLRS